MVDASGLVLGRASSLIAQRLLKGERIIVVNTEKAVVTGEPHRVFSEYTAARARGSSRKGPYFPRYPDRIFRRTIRGMLPFHRGRGREAFRRVMTFIGVPPELAPFPRETLEGARVRPSLRPPVTLGEISRLLGGKVS